MIWLLVYLALGVGNIICCFLANESSAGDDIEKQGVIFVLLAMVVMSLIWPILFIKKGLPGWMK